MSVTLTFSPGAGSGTIAPITGNIGDIVTLPNGSAFTLLGQSPMGWEATVGGNVALGTSYQLVADETFTVAWSATATYTSVVLEPNGASPINATFQVDYISAYPSEAPSSQFPLGYTGHIFTGWNTLADGTGTAFAVGDTIDPSTNTPLFAQWATEPGYSISFDANGGSGSMAVQEGVYYDHQSLAANTFTYVDKHFTGWNTQAGGGGTPYAGGASADGLTGSVTLYVQWTADTNVTQEWPFNATCAVGFPASVQLQMATEDSLTWTTTSSEVQGVSVSSSGVLTIDQNLGLGDHVISGYAQGSDLYGTWTFTVSCLGGAVLEAVRRLNASDGLSGAIVLLLPS